MRLGKLISAYSQSRFILFYSLAERIFFFLFFVMLARKTGTNEYGEITTAFAIANTAAIIFDLGIPIFAQKEISRGKSAALLLNSALSLLLGLLPVYAIAVMTAGSAGYRIPLDLIALIAVPVFLFSVSNLFNKALAGNAEYRPSFSAVMLSRTPALAALAYLHLSGGLTVTSFLVVLLAASVIQIVSLSFSLHRSELLRRFIPDFRQLKMLLPVLPLGAAVAFNFLYDKIDILLISAILGFSESAVYAVAYGLFKGASFGYTFLFVPALTKVSYLSGRPKAVRLYLARLTFVTALICICINAVLFVFAGPLATGIYGERYQESAFLLQALSFAVPAMGLNNLFGVALNGLGMFRENLYVTVAGLAVNIILNIILLPAMGPAGAVVATLATEYLVLAGDSIFLSRYFKQS